MDTITHGIAGAMIGRAFFSPAERAPNDGGSKLGHAAVLATTLGSVFPDIDVFTSFFTHDDLAIIDTHRYVTHSWLCMPLWGVALALLVWAFVKWRRWPVPKFVALWFFCCVGIASHIVFDLITSFGTMIWAPVSRARVSWDLVFIIDVVFTGIALTPHLLAWIFPYQREAATGGWVKSAAMWVLFTAMVEFALVSAPSMGFAFAPTMAVAAPVVLAAIFFLPHWRRWGFQVRASTWNRGGCAALAVYLLICFGAHRVAMHQVRDFAAGHGVEVEAMGAMPMAPNANYWDGMILTRQGVYEAQFQIVDGIHAAPEPDFQFFRDAPANQWISAARELPRVKTYLWFARFPVWRSFERNGQHVVEISDMRFSAPDNEPRSLRFRVVFGADGSVVSSGIVRRGR